MLVTLNKLISLISCRHRHRRAAHKQQKQKQQQPQQQHHSCRRLSVNQEEQEQEASANQEPISSNSSTYKRPENCSFQATQPVTQATAAAATKTAIYTTLASSLGHLSNTSRAMNQSRTTARFGRAAINDHGDDGLSQCSSSLLTMYTDKRRIQLPVAASVTSETHYDSGLHIDYAGLNDDDDDDEDGATTANVDYGVLELVEPALLATTTTNPFQQHHQQPYPLIATSSRTRTHVKSMAPTASTEPAIQPLPQQHHYYSELNEYFGECLSVERLDARIRGKLAELSDAMGAAVAVAEFDCARERVALNMLSSLYEMKLRQLECEHERTMSAFATATSSDRTTKSASSNNISSSKHQHDQRRVGSAWSLRSLFHLTTKRRRQQQQQQQQRHHHQHDNSSCSGSSGSSGSDKHANYSTLEMDTMERRHEANVRAVQYEILEALQLLDAQLDGAKQQHMQQQHHHRSHRHHHQHHHQPHRHSRKRNCNGHHSCCADRSESNIGARRKSLPLTVNNVDAPPVRVHREHDQKRTAVAAASQARSKSTLSNHSIASSAFSIPIAIAAYSKYRNPNASETMV